MVRQCKKIRENMRKKTSHTFHRGTRYPIQDFGFGARNERMFLVFRPYWNRLADILLFLRHNEAKYAKF